MSMHDPIADLLTRIRNGQQARHSLVKLSASKLKEQIVRVLKEEGYIEDYSVEESVKNFHELVIKLKYFRGRPVIETIKRISKPGLRVYKPVKALSAIPGFGIAILSTSMGVMTHKAAKAQNVGGELLCEVA